jgi:hypothetical protein
MQAYDKSMQRGDTRLVLNFTLQGAERRQWQEALKLLPHSVASAASFDAGATEHGAEEVAALGICPDGLEKWRKKSVSGWLFWLPWARNSAASRCRSVCIC